MAIFLENTDTFGGEANYAWANRAYIVDEGLSDRAIVQRAKAWAGYTGLRCRREDWGDTIALYPHGICQVLFISYCERADVDEDKILTA